MGRVIVCVGLVFFISLVSAFPNLHSRILVCCVVLCVRSLFKQRLLFFGLLAALLLFALFVGFYPSLT